MNIGDAIQKATQLLEEEQAHPTLDYRPIVTNDLLSLSARMNLARERNERPRKVHENPKLHVFRSTNFDLLLRVFSQVADADRPVLVAALLNFVRAPMRSRALKVAQFPSFQDRTSALALLAEFCIRTGNLNELLEATAEPQMPTQSLAVMLKEIEEMIALNFTLFSDSELESMPTRLSLLREIAQRQTYTHLGGGRGQPSQKNPHYKPGFAEVAKEIVAAIDGIKEKCRKARYWHLKGALQELSNLEIESDKLKIESFLVKLGFSTEMVKTLNAAESDYKATASPFELKNCLGHLRSFLEHLHRESAKSIATAVGQTVNDRRGDATVFLRQQGFFTKQHEAFVASLYTLLSDESVHPLTADREYARLLRNVVIEYGVMFLTVLDKQGVII